MEAPVEIQQEYNEKIKEGYKAHIIFNANTDAYFVSIFPLSMVNSLLLKIVK